MATIIFRDRLLGVIIFLGACSPRAESMIQTESLGSVQALLANPDVQVLDVRTEAEWEAGHLSRSTWLPPQDWDSAASEVSAETPVLLVCRSGRRAQRVAQTLINAGFSKVHVLVDAGVPELLQL